MVIILRHEGSTRALFRWWRRKETAEGKDMQVHYTSGCMTTFIDGNATASAYNGGLGNAQPFRTRQNQVTA